MSNSLKWLRKARENPCVRSEFLMWILRAGCKGFQSSGCGYCDSHSLGLCYPPETEGQPVTNPEQCVLHWMDRHWKSSFLKYLVFLSPYIPLSLKQPQEIFFSTSETFLQSCAGKNNFKKLFHPSLPNPSVFLTFYACQVVSILIFSPMSSSRPLSLDLIST